MCGICGIVASREVAESELQLQLEKLRHRGPDDDGIWVAGGVAFGHLRLSILDLSPAGHQPMIEPITGCTIVFNGEIYNYVELREQLSGRYTFRTHSDTEVILACYVVYGTSFLTYLRGMFALALFDPRSQEVLLARDRVGIKPLYYRQHHQGFYFASEMKALIGKPLGTPSINESKATEFLVARQLDTTTETLFQGIFQLAPGHYLRLNANGKILQEETFWQIPKSGDRPFEPRHRTELVGKMDETIRLHLRSDVPVGSFVSGGIDSSAVTCFALRHHPTDLPFHTYSAMLPGGNPENELIPLVNNLPGVKKHEFVLDGKAFFDDLPRVIYQHDEPLLDGSMYSHYKLCELAHRDGLKVLLSGAGGDELFGGYLSHVSSYLGRLVKRNQWLKMLKSVRKISSHSDYGLFFLATKGIQEALPFDWRQRWKNQQFSRQFAHIKSPIQIQHFYSRDPDPWQANLLNNYHSWTVPPYLHYEDRNSMAFGIEIRVPFYDHQLMEWVMQFDAGSLVNGSSKTLMRESFKGIVPQGILQQKGKYGFPSPIDQLLRNSAESRALYFDLVPSNPFFKKNEAEHLGKDFFAGAGDLGAFWRALSFSIWYKSHNESR